MNRKMVFYTTGKILIIEGLLLLLPLFVSIIYGESSWLSFAIAITAAFAAGTHAVPAHPAGIALPGFH